jgi:hypothetical protein
VPSLRMWVHCPRASNGLLPRRSDLVGYVQWDARFDQVLLVKQSSPTALQVAVLQADFSGVIGRDERFGICRQQRIAPDNMGASQYQPSVTPELSALNEWRHKRRQQRVGDAENRVASFISAPEFFAFSASSPFIRFSSETLTPPYFDCQMK